jgi:rare lipoprotein A
MLKYCFTAILTGFIVVAPAQAINSGWASYYKSGRLTASGEHFKPLGLTAAHRQLPFGTILKVTNLRNGKSVLVRVNDRGPFVKGRVLDLSLGAAKVIGLTSSGVGKISYVQIR